MMVKLDETSQSRDADENTESEVFFGINCDPK